MVNIGDVLSKMSWNRFKATLHRVMYKGEDRFSVPFFFEPYGRADCNLYLDEYAEMYKNGQEPLSKEPCFYANWLTRGYGSNTETEILDQKWCKVCSCTCTYVSLHIMW